MSNEWETVGTKVVATSKMAIGDTFEGTYVGAKENTTSQFEKKDKDGNILTQYNLLFTDAEGEDILLYPSGTLNYKIQDGAFEVGYDYKITRLENKKGIKAGQFLVQRRPSASSGNYSKGAPGVKTAKPSGATKNA